MTESQINNSVTEDSELSIKEILLKIKSGLKYLQSKWLIILIFASLGAALGVAYSFFNKTIYLATTTFVLEDEKSGNNLNNLAGLASMAGVDIGGGGGGIFQGENILQLYKSRTMLEKTLLTEVLFKNKKILLIDRYIDFNNLREDWRSKPYLSKIKFYPDSIRKNNLTRGTNRIVDSLLGVFVADLSKHYLTVAKPDKKLSTIQVDVKATDEFFAKSFNDELVRNVSEFYINTKTKKTQRNIYILERKTDSVRAVMNGAIYTAVAVSDATPNLNPTRQTLRVVPAQKAQFLAETNKSILASFLQNLELAKITLLKETPLIQVVDQPIYPLGKERFGKTKGFLLGGVILGLLSIIYLIIKKILKEILV